MKKIQHIEHIPNIDIGKVYDQRYADVDIHYDQQQKLADFFGRNMPVHHHDRFFQIQAILDGNVHVSLDETSYSVQAPMLFITPPTVPHSIVTDDGARGHVITIRQEIVWELMEGLVESAWSGESFIHNPLCITLRPTENVAAARILDLLDMMGDERHRHSNQESNQESSQQSRALKSLLQLILINLLRLSDQVQPRKNIRKEDLRVFHRFNELIEEHYQEHITLTSYANIIGVTEARLNEVCRRFAGLPSKRLIIDRLMQEARRQLSFSSASITEIGYLLGFKDPAYFARYFKRNSGITAGQYKESSLKNRSN